MAFGLAVYASPRGSPQRDARLASSCWSDTTGRAFHPQSSYERFRVASLHPILLSQALLGAITSTEVGKCALRLQRRAISPTLRSDTRYRPRTFRPWSRAWPSPAAKRHLCDYAFSRPERGSLDFTVAPHDNSQMLAGDATASAKRTARFASV